MAKRKTLALCLSFLMLLSACSSGGGNNDPVDDHIHQYGSWTADEDGINHSRTCSECGDKLSEAHSFGRGVVKDGDAPTHTSEGKRTYTCSVCGYEKSETIARLEEHSFDLQVTNDATKKSDATCTEPAIYYYSCECGQVSDSDTFYYGSALGHQLSGGLEVEEGYQSVYDAGEQFDLSSVTAKVFCERENEKITLSASDLEIIYENDASELACSMTSVTVRYKNDESFTKELPITVNHLYKYQTRDGYDVEVCESCGNEGKQFITALENNSAQYIDLSAETHPISLTGVSEYVSVSSITLGSFELGNDISNLDISSLLTTESNIFGERDVNVIVTDSDGNDHAVRVPVCVATKVIYNKDDFASLYTNPSSDWASSFPGLPEVLAGYYVLGADIDMANEAFKSGVEKWDNKLGFQGTLDGRGHTIDRVSSASAPLFPTLGNSGTIKNINFTNVSYSVNRRWALLVGVAANAGSIENVYVSVNKYVARDGATSDDLKASSMLVARGNDVSYKDVTINASGFELYNVLGNHITSIRSIENFTVYCKDYQVIGNNDFVYSGACTPADAIPEGVIINKDIALSAQTVDLSSTEPQGFDFDGALDGATIKSITVTASGTTYDLGTDINALTIPSEFKNDKASHGVQTVALCAVLNGIEKTYTFDTTFVTGYVANATDLSALMPSGANVYGYYKVTADFYNWNAAPNFDWNVKFCGTLDGQGHTINTSYNTNGMLSNLDNAVIKNITLGALRYTGFAGAAILSKVMSNTVLENVTFNIESVRSGGYDPVLASYCGMVTYAMSHDIVYRNCNFDFPGIKVSYLIGRNQTYTVPFDKVTFVDSTFTCLTYEAIWYNEKTSEVVKEADGLTITTGATKTDYTGR